MFNAFGFRYIEALGFAHYLEHGTLVSYEEVQLTLSDENGIPVRMLHVNHTRMAEFCTLRVTSVFHYSEGRLLAGLV